MATFNTAPIGATGGFHVPNYHRNSTTGHTPAPIQAGKIYGPFAFSGSKPFGLSKPVPGLVRPTSIRVGTNKTAYPATNLSGYAFK